MENERKLQNKLLKDLDSKIISLKKELKILQQNKIDLSEKPSKYTIFAQGQTFDYDDENILMVKVGMSFCNKYGDQGIITKLNEDRKSVQGINFETKKEEYFSIERFTSCGFYELDKNKEINMKSNQNEEEKIKNKFFEKSTQMELSGSHLDYVLDYVLEGLSKSSAKRKSTRIKHTIKHLSDNYEKLELGSSHYDIVEIYTTEILEECL